MDLEEKKQELQKDINNYSYWLKENKAHLHQLKNCRQPETSELYNNMDSLISVTKEKGNYEFILGGDGRSQPWSETREGIIATITLAKGIYLSGEQKRIVRTYVKEIHNPDNIVWEDYSTQK
jgi:hypothetical protein